MVSSATGRRATGDRHATLIHFLGTSICSGEMPPGTVISADELCERHGVSRSVVREALRVMSSMGLVAAKRGVGTTTQPLAAWNLFDPSVIQWRLGSPDRLRQLRELAELRVGFEPEAAALAAHRHDADDIERVLSTGAQLWAAAHRGDTEGFLALDITFHGTVLEASGNPMYTQYGPIIAALLQGRAEHGLAKVHPSPEALERHMAVMRAIQRGDPDRARSEARALILDSLAESRSLWDEDAATGGADPGPETTHPVG